MPKKTQRVTIMDVAKAAGVSKQTVSRVINGRSDVSETTRQQIQAIIDDLGFRRSEMARGFTHGRSYTLAVVGDKQSYFGSKTYTGMVDEAEPRGYALLTKQLADASRDSMEQLLHTLHDRHVDGVLWALPDAGFDLSPLVASGIPAVFISHAQRPGLLTLSYDNFAAGQQATQRLIEGGRRRIAHITGPSNWWLVQERLRGWRTALQQAGFPADDGQIAQGDWDAESGYVALMKLHAEFAGMDAVFVQNDKMALGAMLAAHTLGLRIPEDLAVIGFDNMPEGVCFYPPLTTMLQDKRVLGQRAARMLIQVIESSDSVVPEEPPLCHQLIVRQSA